MRSVFWLVILILVVLFLGIVLILCLAINNNESNVAYNTYPVNITSMIAQKPNAQTIANNSDINNIQNSTGYTIPYKLGGSTIPDASTNISLDFKLQLPDISLKNTDITFDISMDNVTIITLININNKIINKDTSIVDTYNTGISGNQYNSIPLTYRSYSLLKKSGDNYVLTISMVDPTIDTSALVTIRNLKINVKT